MALSLCPAENHIVLDGETAVPTHGLLRFLHPFCVVRPFGFRFVSLIRSEHVVGEQAVFDFLEFLFNRLVSSFSIVIT